MILPCRLRVVPLLLAVLLTTAPLAAATHRPRDARRSLTGFLSEAWSLVTRIWEGADGPAGSLRKSGSSIDPFGNPAAGAQSSATGTSATKPSTSGG